MNAWKVILAALVIYVAGIVTGKFGANLGEKKPRPNREAFSPRPPMMHDLARKMESRLDLTADQREQVQVAMEASQERMRALMNEMRPKFAAESQAMRVEIEALLNEDQKTKFAQVFERSNRRGPGGPGGRPGGRREGRFDRGPHGGGPDFQRERGPREGGRRRRPEMEDRNRPGRPERPERPEPARPQPVAPNPGEQAGTEPDTTAPAPAPDTSTPN